MGAGPSRDLLESPPFRSTMIRRDGSDVIAIPAGRPEPLGDCFTLSTEQIAKIQAGA